MTLEFYLFIPFIDHPFSKDSQGGGIAGMEAAAGENGNRSEN